MTFNLKIELENAAMEEPLDVVTALQDVAGKIQKYGFESGRNRIRDENGNTVGYWEVSGGRWGLSQGGN